MTAQSHTPVSHQPPTLSRTDNSDAQHNRGPRLQRNWQDDRGLRKLYAEHHRTGRHNAWPRRALAESVTHARLPEKMEVSEEASLQPRVCRSVSSSISSSVASMRAWGRYVLYSPDLRGVSEYSFRSSFHALEMLSSMTYQVSETFRMARVRGVSGRTDHKDLSTRLPHSPRGGGACCHHTAARDTGW